MNTKVALSGLLVAGIGFFLTRFTVTLAVYDDGTRFLLAGVVPLVLGLSLATAGVVLAVGDFDPSFVQTTALWCVLGCVSMLGLVVLTLLGSTAGESVALESVRSRTYLSNFLIGGSVGGTLTGLYAARNHRHRRDLRQQANRLEVLNRILRDEVLNAVTAIRGYVRLGDGGTTDRNVREIIDQQSQNIERTIEDVKFLSQTTRSSPQTLGSVDLTACLEHSLQRARDRHPNAEISLDENATDDLRVRANSRLEHVFDALLENAVEHNDGTPHVTVSVTAAGDSVRVSIADDGPGLPDRQRALLEQGHITEYDDPTAGFGLNVVRFLVESYQGTIETAAADDGTTITVSLDRTDNSTPGQEAGVTAFRASTPQLGVALGASLVAAVAMGILMDQLANTVPVIGALYGIENALVGWITHAFHSAVFGLVFVGLLTEAPARYARSPGSRAGIGVLWGFVLWLVAAGVIMPVWLRFVGLPAPIPNLSGVSLLGHLVWGVTLGGLTWVGEEHVLDRLPVLERSYLTDP